MSLGLLTWMSILVVRCTGDSPVLSAFEQGPAGRLKIKTTRDTTRYLNAPSFRVPIPGGQQARESPHHHLDRVAGSRQLPLVLASGQDQKDPNSASVEHVCHGQHAERAGEGAGRVWICRGRGGRSANRINGRGQLHSARQYVLCSTTPHTEYSFENCWS